MDITYYLRPRGFSLFQNLLVAGVVTFVFMFILAKSASAVTCTLTYANPPPSYTINVGDEIRVNWTTANRVYNNAPVYFYEQGAAAGFDNRSLTPHGYFGNGPNVNPAPPYALQWPSSDPDSGSFYFTATRGGTNIVLQIEAKDPEGATGNAAGDPNCIKNLLPTITIRNLTVNTPTIEPCNSLNPVLKVTWNKFTDPSTSYYVVKRKQQSTGTTIQVGTVTQTNNPNFTDDVQAGGEYLKSGEDYAYQVIAYDSSDVELIRDTGPYLDDVPMCITTPTVLTCANGQPRLRVSWSAFSDTRTDRYRVFRKDASGAETSVALLNGVNNTTFTDPTDANIGSPPTITQGATYAYKIVAENNSGTNLSVKTSTYSQPTLACNPPGSFDDATIQVCNDPITPSVPVVVISWNRPTNMIDLVSTYDIRRSNDNFATSSVISTVFAPALEYRDRDVVQGDNFKYRVVAKNNVNSRNANDPPAALPQPVYLCLITASCTGSSNSPQNYAGPTTDITWQTSNVKGGSGPGTYTYAWSNPGPGNLSDDLNDPSQTGANATIPGTQAGPYYALVTISSPGVPPAPINTCTTITLIDNTAPPNATTTVDLTKQCYTSLTWPGGFNINASDPESGISLISYRVRDNTASNCFNFSTTQFGAVCSNLNAQVNVPNPTLPYLVNFPYLYFTNGSHPPNHNYEILFSATNGAGMPTPPSGFETYPFEIKNACIDPFIQTQGGDVHSNEEISPR